MWDVTHKRRQKFVQNFGEKADGEITGRWHSGMMRLKWLHQDRFVLRI
jgi:hypothetical protein